MDIANLLIGGAPWLDLTNTIYMRDGDQQDLLEDKDALLQWLTEANLVNSPSDIKAIDIDSFISSLKSLRNLCFSILKDIADGNINIQPINQYLTSFHLTVQLSWSEEKLITSYSGLNLNENILFQIAYSIAETIRDVPFDRIRQCEHDECILHFIDSSKGGKRRWCSMETCGNRHKANAFYRKKRIEKAAH